jgi:hypothetical protein
MTIYPEAIFMVGLVLLAFLLSRWLADECRTVHLYAIAVTCFALAWLRPVGIVLAVICLAVALWRRRALIHIAICVALIISANVALDAWQRKFGEVRSMNGRILFFKTYLQSGGMGASGPNGLALRRVLVDLFRDELAQNHDLRSLGGPAMSDQDYRLLYLQYAGDPEQLVDAMFRHPTTQYFWTMFCAADAVRGAHPDRLFLWTAIEHARAHPVETAQHALDGYRSLVIGPAWWFFRDKRKTERPYFEPVAPQRDPVRDDMVVRISKTPFAEGAWPAAARLLDVAFSSSYRVILPVAYVLMVIGVLGFMFTPGAARRAALTVFLIHSCNVVALAVLVDVKFRYQVQSVPLAIVGGGIGAYWIARRLSMLGDRLRPSRSLPTPP